MVISIYVSLTVDRHDDNRNVEINYIGTTVGSCQFHFVSVIERLSLQCFFPISKRLLKGKTHFPNPTTFYDLEKMTEYGRAYYHTLA